MKTTRLTANLHTLPLMTEDGKVSEMTLMDVLGGKAGTLKSLGLVFVTESPAVGTKAKSDAKAAAAKPPGVPFMMDAKTKSNLTGVKPIRKGSKVDDMMKMLLRKSGATFEQIKNKFGWSDGAVGSYLYWYPKNLGYSMSKEVHGNKAVYRVQLPEGLNGLMYT